MIKRIHIGLSDVILLGTSHIAEQSAMQVKELFKKENPGMLALELDAERFNTLLLRVKKQKYHKEYYRIKGIGIQGFLFAKVASFIQEKLAARLGVKPGIEMETALKIAMNNKNIKIILVDQNIRRTLKNFSNEIPLSEKLKLVFIDPLLGFFIPQERMTLNLRKVPSDKLITKIMNLMRKRYPYIYKVLVEDRNKVISENLIKVVQNNPGEKILCVLGAGHINGVYKLLQKYSKSNVSVSYTFSFS